ncbi:MAG: glutathione S-transferase family protein [Cyanobacteria bacterium P01_G01_bin.38]
MAILSTQDQSVKQLKGLHLYHTDFCDCCDLVRITLAQKHLEWVSHYLDVIQGDHLSVDFFSLNPQGLVPVLVHNGIVINESQDIVRYLDQRFPDRSLVLMTLRHEQRLWTAAAAKVRQYIGVLCFEFLIKAFPFHRMNYAARTKLHQQQGRTPGFYLDLGSRARVDYDDIGAALQAVNRALQRLEQTLQDRPYLVGQYFSSADIAWLVQVHRLKILKLEDLEQYPQVVSWYNTLQAHPAVQQGMVAWESKLLYDRFEGYIAQREKSGNGINARIWRGQGATLLAS